MPLKVSEFEVIYSEFHGIIQFYISTVQRNNDSRELLKDIDANYELVCCGLREILKTVDSLKAYAANNIETYGAEGVLIPVLHTLNNIEAELKDLVAHRLVLFLSDIMG